MQAKQNVADRPVDVVLSASRVLVGLAARSLPESADVTLHQFRALALLDAREELNVNSLAELLGVSPSTVTRLCDRLVRKDLIQRRHGLENRREVGISISPAGSALVADVVARRRKAIQAILARMPVATRRQLATGLQAFVDATDDEPAYSWHLG